MSPTMDYTETLVVIHCWCGIAVGIPSNLNRYARDTKGHAIYCPLGHSFVFGNSFEEKLKAEREERAREQRQLKATRDLLAAEERSHVATRGHLTRAKKRAHNGVCLHCNRSFADVARHMRTKHPEETES